MRTVITGGTVCRAEGMFRGEVLLDDGGASGRILEVGEGVSREGAEVVDASDCLVIPGGVDVHTHLALSVGGNSVADGFAAGTLAAGMGGTTCIVEHPGFGPEGCDLLHQLKAYEQLAEGNAFVDYAFHGVFQRADADILRQIPELVASGVPSAKAYMTYAGKLDDAGLLAVLDALGKAGGLLTVHAESDAMIAYLSGLLRDRAADPASHPASRPSLCEAEAVNRVVALAAVARAPLYVVHLSTASGLALIRAAQAAGEPVLAETCPQYLVLTEERYAEPDALKYVMAPPLRTRADCEALWQGLADASIAVAATDHCAFSLEQKTRLGADNVFHCPGGAAGVETRLPLLFSEGVLRSRLTVPRFVEVTATAPARIMGLSRKGRLEPGADADVVIFDPAAQRVISAETLHQKTDSTPFAGLNVTGWPRDVWLRGQRLVENGRQAADIRPGRRIRRAALRSV